jgi:hypothetical protein
MRALARMRSTSSRSQRLLALQGGGASRSAYCPTNRTMPIDVLRDCGMGQGVRGTDILGGNVPTASTYSNAPPDVRRLGKPPSARRD